MAACEMARSLLVVLPIADTTTIGWRWTRALTIVATRSMAAADSTEVPPNFITIMSESQMSIEMPFQVHQFRIEHRGPGCATDRVVAEGNELPVEHRARTEAADKRRHTALAF